MCGPLAAVPGLGLFLSRTTQWLRRLLLPCQLLGRHAERPVRNPTFWNPAGAFFFFFSFFFLALCTSYSLWYLTATPSLRCAASGI